MHGVIKVDNKPLITTKNVIKFEGTKSTDYLAQQFADQQNTISQGYSVSYGGNSLINISTDDPSKTLEGKQYEIKQVYGGNAPLEQEPLDKTIHLIK